MEAAIKQLESFLMTIGDWALSMIGRIIICLIIWKVGCKLLKWLISIMLKAMHKADIDREVDKFMSSLVKFVGYVVLILIIADILGFQTASLITLLGSAGLAIGMSLQGSLSNFAGGILILIFKPFKSGDYIIAGGNEGVVDSVGLLYTKLKTIDNKNVLIPNGTLSNSPITNVSSENERRLDVDISIGYDNNIKKAKDLLMEVIASEERVIKDKGIEVIVKSLDESCVTLETRTWVKTSDYWDVRFKFLEEYKNVFDENNIEIPYNQLDVHIREK